MNTACHTALPLPVDFSGQPHPKKVLHTIFGSTGRSVKVFKPDLPLSSVRYGAFQFSITNMKCYVAFSFGKQNFKVQNDSIGYGRSSAPT